MLKSLKQLLNCLKRAEASAVLIVDNDVFYDVHVYTVTAQDELGTNKHILISDQDITKRLFSQYSLTG